MRKAWIREVDDDVFVVTNNSSKGYFFKSNSFIEACELTESVNHFIDAFNKLKKSIFEIEMKGVILLTDEVQK